MPIAPPPPRNVCRDPALLEFLRFGLEYFLAEYKQSKPDADGAPTFHFLAYCILRGCELKHELAMDLADMASVTDNAAFLPSWFAAIAADPLFVKWPLRAQYYLARRLLGEVHQGALVDSWAGRHALRYKLDADFALELNALYRDNGLPLTAKTMPKVIEDAVLTPLGAGNFNTVSLVELTDPEDSSRVRKYAFKPSSPNSRSGWGAEITGIALDVFEPDPLDSTRERIRLKNYHPECRTIASYNLLHVLGLDGFVQKSFMGIVNGQLGVLTEYVEGPRDQTTGSTVDPRPVGKLKTVDIVDKRMCKFLKRATPREFSRLEDIVGAAIMQRRAGPGYCVQGAFRNIDTATWNEPAFRALYADAAFLRRALNDQDGHTGNYLAGVDQTGGLRVLLIDLDQALGPVEPDPASIPDYYDVFATVNERHITRTLEQRFQPQLHEAEIYDALRGLLEEEEIAANVERLKALRQNIDSGAVIVIDQPQQWMDPMFDSPALSVLGRHRFMMEERLSAASMEAALYVSDSDND